MTKRSLWDEVDACEIHHSSFRQIYDELTARIDDALLGMATKISWVIGPSRIGKSQLIKALQRKYPPIVERGCTTVPVVFAGAPSSTTIQLLPMVVLTALKVPIPKGIATAGKLTLLMNEQLALAGTKAIVFDEASQVVDRGTRIVPFDASEWFKDAINVNRAAQMLFGVPRLTRLFDTSTQLPGRAFKRMVWLPYDASVAEEREEYHDGVHTFLKIFERLGWPASFELKEATGHCYLHAPGSIGGLGELMREMARQLKSRPPRPLLLADLANACSSLEHLGDPALPAFTKVPVTMAALAQAYRHVLRSNDLAGQ